MIECCVHLTSSEKVSNPVEFGRLSWIFLLLNGLFTTTKYTRPIAWFEFPLGVYNEQNRDGIMRTRECASVY